MERCVPAPHPFHSETTVSVACSVLGHAAASHERGGPEDGQQAAALLTATAQAFARAHLLQPDWRLL